MLRLRPGEPVTVSDGRGGLLPCRFGPGGSLVPDGEPQRQPRTEPQITIGFAVMKGDRPEWTVQKLTEVGVDRVIPLSSARSVVRWDNDRAERNRQRLARVAREAAMQSRRLWLPVVDRLRTLGELGDLGSVALAEPGGAPPSLTRPSVVVGPEGGWTEDELAGRPTVGLGPTVLRAETAAVAAGVLLAGLRARLVTPG